MKKFFIIAMSVFCLTSCDQYVSKKFGGTTTIKLEKGEKLIEATWKEDGNIWYLVEPMDSNYTPKTKIFKESSTYGVLEGKVIFIESH
jgi:hypothetical protein